MTIAERIEADLKAEIAEAGRAITDPKALAQWMSDNGIGRSTMSAATGADYQAVTDKQRASVRDVTREQYARLSRPLTPENFPGDAARWAEWKPHDLLTARLAAALEMMRHPHAHWIVDLYVEHDGRFPDPEGFGVWTGWLDAGESVEDVRRWIVGGFKTAA